MIFLVKKAQKGDKVAFIQLMEQNKESMYRVAHGFFRNENDIADAMQETILSAYEHLPSLKKPAYFKTWLIRILINKCNYMLRYQKHFTPEEYVPETGTSEELQSNLEFQEMLDTLPEDSKIIFLLYYGECFTTREISEILNINENTIRGRLRRGRTQLHEWITANS